ncbi:ADP-ribosylglycohydrolase family protein [Kiritimatiellaeota bacterium B1221]|nr:ADP-ribosylglycohydrolase family protein [Kiritimatiellaeota bacterium B1221]
MHQPELKDRIEGCWIGKGIGGTLGMPFEGCKGPLSVSFDQISNHMLPNDDLDLQLLWLKVLEEHGLNTRARHLAHAAAKHYHCYPDEYGVARWNTARGWEPPLTGRHNNRFGDGMGAAIRSELWACIAPGRPSFAASLAREDALVDHFGDGVYAEMFLAAMESHLLVSGNLADALASGFDHIPTQCRLAKSLRQIQNDIEKSYSLEEILERRDRKFPTANFTDVIQNLCTILLALLSGKGDVENSLLLAISCGGDTDCTGATLGSILGILHGASGFPPHLRALAGSDLAFHPSLGGLGLPEKLEELTDRCLTLCQTWEDLPDAPLPNLTPDEAPVPADPHHWLIFNVPVEKSMSGEPENLREIQNHPENFSHLHHCENGIHLDLTSRVNQPGDVLYLFTWIRVEVDCEAKLMACADAGITVWFDEKEIINYHGRHPAIPAFHRTEGGATVRVTLEANKTYPVRIRLLTGSGVLNGCLALGDQQDRYLHPVHFDVPGISNGKTL